MLSDYLKGEYWQSVMAGVQMCKLPANRFSQGTYAFPSENRSFDRYEFFFCFSGSFSFLRSRNSVMKISEQEICLLSDFSDIKAVEVTDPPTGYCILVDRVISRPAFEALYRILGHSDFFDGRVQEMIARHDGCMRIHKTSWNQAAFRALDDLPGQEQGNYCVMKIAELVYLLCARHALLDAVPTYIPVLGYSPHTLYRIRAYMETHLDEKLTIAELSRQFHLSATALKNGFRTLFGQPIHKWLQEKRMCRAAELLQFSNLNILQIAQSVGYEGVSQFNVVFKRKYGKTPSCYRKMSNSVTFRPIP